MVHSRQVLWDMSLCLSFDPDCACPDTQKCTLQLKKKKKTHHVPCQKSYHTRKIALNVRCGNVLELVL